MKKGNERTVLQIEGEKMNQVKTNEYREKLQELRDIVLDDLDADLPERCKVASEHYERLQSELYIKLEKNGINTSAIKVQKGPDFKEFIPKISSKEGVVE